MVNNFKSKYLSKSKFPYFISEIGINHNGKLALAIEMIKQSKSVGFDAVKFQKRDAKDLRNFNLKTKKPIGYLIKSKLDIPKKTVKFGIFGLGRVVENRVYSVFVSEITNSKVVAVFDKNPKKNVKFSSMFNCETTNTLKDFLSKDIDIVYVATESGNHYNNIIYKN